MTTTTDEQGLMNNFAKEPSMYYAKAPSAQAQRRYIFLGAIGTMVIAASILTAVVVS